MEAILYGLVMLLSGCLFLMWRMWRRTARERDGYKNQVWRYKTDAKAVEEENDHLRASKRRLGKRIDELLKAQQ